MSCRYDPDTGTYQTPDGPCRTDAYGDPTHHCQARRTCSQHVAPREQTCARCLGRTRTDITWIERLAALMLPQAIDNGIHSQAAYLAAPAADPEHTRATRFWVDGHTTHAYRTGRITADTFTRILGALPDDDTWHPHSVTTRWQLMLSEDYGHPLPARLTLTSATTYLDRHLSRIAQDPAQDFSSLARDMRQLHQRLETAIRNNTTPDRGAPCPDCADAGHLTRLTREYGHWCRQPDCERIHYRDDTGDLWRCPTDPDHYWSHAWYIGYIEDRGALTG